MANTLYSATGCTRCKIVKHCMTELGIDYEEQDIKAEGKEAFQKFYASNRKSIVRGEEGVEFPIFSDGMIIRQGIGPVLAYLNFQEKLNGFFSVGSLHKEWVDGIHVSNGNPAYAEEFVQILRCLKKNNMKLQMDTDGRNPKILEAIMAEQLVDVVLMNVKGPYALYSQITRDSVEASDIEKSMLLVVNAPVFRFRTILEPFVCSEGMIRFLTPDEVAATAQWMAQVTGTNKLAYSIAICKQSDIVDDRLKAIEAITNDMLLRYRSAARNHQVFADIEKS